MSIDKLITELDRDPRDLKVIKECGEQGLHDYVGVSEAYASLLGTVLDKPEKVELICKILSEVISSIRGLNELNRLLNLEDGNLEELDLFAGQVLHGEQSIDALIAEFDGQTT